MNKPFSQACENNKEVIREVLAPYVESGGVLLEIGSGTGQHGAYMTSFYPDLTWQTSDQPCYLEGINAWVSEAQRANFRAPIELDVNHAPLLKSKADFIFTANTAHIMSWKEVTKLFDLIPSYLTTGGYFFLYGPFNYEGQFTSESNARFDDWLKGRAAHQGIRDFEAINKLAVSNGMVLASDNAMPANNRLLIWKLEGNTAT